MQIEKSFTYQFEDQESLVKLGLGALVSIIPIVNLALVGYTVAIIRNVAERDDRPLPQWDDFGSKFRDGLILAIAGLIYSAPLGLALLFSLALPIRSGAFSHTGAIQDFWQSLLGLSALALACAFILYALLLSLIRPVVLVIFSRDGTFASCFRLREIFEIITRQPRAFIITWLAVWLAGVAVGLIVGFMSVVVGWVPCLGWLVGLALGLGSAIYLITIDGYLFGQLRLAALGPVTQPATILPESQT